MTTLFKTCPWGEWCTEVHRYLGIEHSIQLGFALLNRMINLSTHENNRTMELINIHYLYKIVYMLYLQTVHFLQFSIFVIFQMGAASVVVM